VPWRQTGEVAWKEAKLVEGWLTCFVGQRGGRKMSDREGRGSKELPHAKIREAGGSRTIFFSQRLKANEAPATAETCTARQPETESSRCAVPGAV